MNSTYTDSLFDQDGQGFDDDIDSGDVSTIPLKGLTNSQRRSAVFRKQLLSRLFERSSKDVASVLSGLTSVESSIDATLTEITLKNKRDGFLLDEQTVSDLLKIAGACSAMRQQMLLIAETVSEFNHEKQGA